MHLRKFQEIVLASVVTLVCGVGIVPSRAAEGVLIEGTTILTTTVRGIDHVRSSRFNMFIATNGWNIFSQIDGQKGNIESREVAKAGDTIYYLSRFSKNPKSFNGGTAEIEIAAAPASNTTGEPILWASFIGSQPLMGKSEGSLPSLGRPGNGTGTNEEHQKVLIVLDSQTQMPETVALLSDGTVRERDKSGVVVTNILPVPFDKGYTGSVLRLQGWTNVSGRFYPISGVMINNYTDFTKKPYSTKPSQTFSFSVSRIAPSSRAFLIPKIDRIVNVADRRYESANPPLPTVTYFITNGVWPELNSPALKSLHLQQTRTEELVRTKRAPPAKSKLSTLTRVAAVCLFIVVTAVVLVSVKQNKNNK